MNALEQMSAIEELQAVLAALHAKMLKEASRMMMRWRLPGEWTPERLHTAHTIAKHILTALEPYKNTNDCKAAITRKLDPLVAMHYRVHG